MLAGPGPSRADPRRTAGGTSLVATAVDAGSPADSTDRRTDPHVRGRSRVFGHGSCGAATWGRAGPIHAEQQKKGPALPVRKWMLGSRLSHRPQERPTCPWSIRHCRPWLLRCLRVRGRAGPIHAEQQEGPALLLRQWTLGVLLTPRTAGQTRTSEVDPGFQAPASLLPSAPGSSRADPRRTAGGTSLVATAVDAGSPADPTGRRTDPHVCGRCGVSEPGLCCAVGFQVKPGRSTQNSRRRDRPCRCVSGCWGPGYPTDRRKDPLVRGRSGIAGPGFCGACGSGAEPGRSPQNSRRDQPCCYGSGRWESC